MNNATISTMPNTMAVATATNYGRFAIGPLETGIGTTLGNALRRILLSSLPGSAITSIRIQNVFHEFSCIPSVKEDVTEIVMNVKGIRLRSYSERQVRLQLSKSGSGEARAGDIDLPANVELVNPELVLATLDGPEAHLEMELTVERGRGYVSFEAREGMPISTIPVDAIFSPIPKVNYVVEPASLELLAAGMEDAEQASNLDASAVEGREQLVIEIWTDGTIDPGEALSIAGQYLAQHSSLISNFNRVLATAQRELPNAIAIPPHLFEMAIDDLSLSMRTYNCLKRSGITKVGQVLRMDRKDLLGLRNFGEKSFDELHQVLSSRDLIPPGTPLDLSAREDTDDYSAEGGEGDEGDDGVEDVDYAEFDDVEPDPNVFMQELGGDNGEEAMQIVDPMGVSQGSMVAAAGIYIDDEPASTGVDLEGGIFSVSETLDSGAVEGLADGSADEAEAKPKARSKKKA